MLHSRVLALVLAVAGSCALSLAAQSSLPPTDGTSVSSSATAYPQTPPPAPSSPVEAPKVLRTYIERKPFRDWGIDGFVGLNGAGVDIATPVARHFNARVGGSFLRYTGHFTSDGAQIDASLQVGGAKASLDWYPWTNGFRVSPLFVFGIQTKVRASVLVPPGQNISLDDHTYFSSATDPLRGAAGVDTRKVAPGLSIGFGNIIPRRNQHFSFPVEVGFYYINQPRLKVTFQGSACIKYGCEDVTKDPEFQSDLQEFIARNNHNLSYASFFPVASFGVGYRF